MSAVDKDKANRAQKGNRAEQELCRKLREFGFTVRKARMSKGEWDRIATPPRVALLRAWPLFSHWIQSCGCRVLEAVVVGEGAPIYFDITTNSTRGRVKALLKKRTPEPGLKVLAVRYDGKGSRPARWRFWIA